MRYFKPKIVLAILAGCVLLGLAAQRVLTGLPERITLKGIHLSNVRKAWLLDGSPAAPNVEKYTNATNSACRTFVWTNVYIVDSNRFESLFAADDTGFDGKGILVVTKNGQLVWVDKIKGPRLIK